MDIVPWSGASVVCDATVIEAWLAGDRTPSTRQKYRRHAREFLAFTGKSLGDTRSDDVRAFFEHGTKGTLTSRATALSAIKSLFAHARRTGALSSDPGAEVQLPHARYAVQRHVVDSRDIDRMLSLERDGRNSAILTTAYSGGLLPSEIVALKWGDATPSADGGAALRVVGYKGRVRTVRLRPAAWDAVSKLRGGAAADEPIFESSKGGHMVASSVHRVVKAAVARAGLPANMSTYWLRHAQVAHSMAAGVPLRQLQQDLGHTEPETTQRYVRMFVRNDPISDRGGPASAA